MNLIEEQDHIPSAFHVFQQRLKPFLNFVTRVGFGPFAWYRIVFGAVLLGVLAIGWL